MSHLPAPQPAFGFDANRRRFMRTAALGGAGAVLARAVRAETSMAIVTRNIPRSGERLPVVGLGTWQAFDIGADAAERAEAAATLRTFVDAHLRVIDTSPMYGAAEANVGALLSGIAGAESVFLATKVWSSDAASGRRQIDNSFKLLKRERLDLIEVHNLLASQAQLATLAQLKRDQRVRYLGVTHYTASAHADLVAHIERGNIDFVQVNYSLLEPQAGATVLAAARTHGVAVLINRPLADGAVLARVRNRPLPAIAEELGARTWAHLALKWIIADDAVTCVIPGTRNPAHLLDNIAAGSGAMPDAAMRMQIAAAFERA